LRASFSSSLEMLAARATKDGDCEGARCDTGAVSSSWTLVGPGHERAHSSARWPGKVRRLSKRHDSTKRWCAKRQTEPDPERGCVAAAPLTPWQRGDLAAGA
jgi:hypothetical protein